MNKEITVSKINLESLNKLIDLGYNVRIVESAKPAKPNNSYIKGLMTELKAQAHKEVPHKVDEPTKKFYRCSCGRYFEIDQVCPHKK